MYKTQYSNYDRHIKTFSDVPYCHHCLMFFFWCCFRYGDHRLAMVRPTLVLVCGLLSAVLVDFAWSASGPVIQQCPTHGEITPCVCTVKKNGGLDILCEFTDLVHISKTMTVLKGKPSLVIFYLKLRHNNLPKLQGFVFLGMDIRHLTIHNSTLAVVEESSLSSIGEQT